jgi:predicted metal-binding membrane protein
MTTSASDSSRGDVRTAMIGLFGVAAVAWISLFTGTVEQALMPGGGSMPMPGGGSMPMQPAWTLAYAATVLAMWAIMMVAMMLPVGAPAIIRAVRRANSAPRGLGGLWMSLVFAAAYMAVWLGFAVVATLLQWGLDSADLLSESMAVSSRVIASLLAIAIGLYQFSSFKQESLRRCRASGEHLSGHSGRRAASVWALGLTHGVSCLICVWALMLLPFIGGLMNPVWMAAAMFLALAERIFPKGDGVARLSGAGLVALGGYALAIAVH